MTIYRIQDAEGRGPFRPGLSLRWIDDEAKPHESTLKPWPEEFPEVFFAIRIFRTIYCGCGCNSPEQLKLWFSKLEIRKMEILGLNPVIMEVDEILAESPVQLVFRRLKPLREDVKPFKLY
jgi:hypothetical protein